MPATTRSASKAQRVSKESAAYTKVAHPAPPVRNFWRTLATARPSTGGKDSDPAAAKRIADEFQARQKALGIVNGRSYGHWKDGRMGGTWIRVDPKTKEPLGATHCG